MLTFTSTEAAARAVHLASSFLGSEKSNETEVLLHDILCYLSWYLEAKTVPTQCNYLGYAKELIGELYDSTCEESANAN